jgi:hypothetical protein
MVNEPVALGSTAELDALWAMAPASAKAGIVVSPRGLVMLEPAWHDRRLKPRDTAREPERVAGRDARSRHGARAAGPYISNPPAADPWGHPYRMACGANLPPGAKYIAVWSVGPDGQTGTADDVTSWK